MNFQDKMDLEAHIDLINHFINNQDFINAEVVCKKAALLSPNNPFIYNNLGNIQSGQGKLDEAVESYEWSLKLDPTFAKAHFNLGLVLQKRFRYEEALKCYQNTLLYQNDHSDAYYNMGFILVKLGKIEAAIDCISKAIALIPSGKLFLMLASIYTKISNLSKAREIFVEGLKYDPENIELLGGLVMILRQCCLWDDLYHFMSRLKMLIKKSILKDTPFPLFNFQWLGLDYTLSKQLIITKKLTHYHFSHLKPLKEKMNFMFKRQSKQKIRLGYVSGDIRDHATSHLIMNMFSYHNRERFEIFLYSIGPKDESDYRKNIISQVDHFVDLFSSSVEECAKRIYGDKIDILIDMMGYTAHSKIGLFTLKPAPIQCSYLAYPGTTGSDFIDYLIVDKVIIPQEEKSIASEKFIYLPHTLFVTDDQQPIANQFFSRTECHLPEDVFVYCCFNQTYKIDPPLFECWMRILKQVPRSVLWLYYDVEMSDHNLRKEAERRGVDPDRIIFATKMSKELHLARLQLADLALDCFSINSGTTAIDALWAGIPLIGYENKMRPRIISSILSAFLMPELIMKSETDYEKCAVFYGMNRNALTLLRSKVQENRKKAPLFKTKYYVENLEKAFEEIWKIYEAGDPPREVYINASAPACGRGCLKDR